ncbi:DUF4917 family protein [Mycobacteroides abscessus]|uniref:DUF4917 family protein n=3 Tax=Mycobacteroides abscessus TaxID=36809 RepID=A0AB38D3V6_9MYCO|nr:DUF4917 family protein [Mycobacteroides abscessus]MBE5419893.1 hypothetical protein [Mycobacteroides abscessus]MBE5455407.1 hypothetical protein [Mycobacteroides abscessus]MBN7299175.1 DUF4917 family protein [Mycobacteroides abscessus subsp. abscessus]MBN7334821.1 DUF4917 family protein [Mycobacteroides abscessus subsp. abscessus]MBN7411541.1 DUF4917 family protein [Mycobacteroides abscessus subsp. abscessus]
MANSDGDELIGWSDIAGGDWPTLLVGNGLSINIWNKFAYSELRTHAHLNSPAERLFCDLETVNFEEVLESLWHAGRVSAALGQDSAAANDLYTHVRLQLVTAIQGVHLQWSSLPSEHLGRIAATLDQHRWVFTLNYDLLTYWSLMNNLSSTEIVDFLWNNPFNPADANLRSGGATGLLFLHGGIHLWHDSLSGESGKWTYQQQGGLLSRLGTTLDSHPDRLPLIVSEGRSEQKLRAIRRSDYLSFGYQKLWENSSPTVIFGASFGPQDAHIVRALRSGPQRKIAISVFPVADAAAVVATKATYRALLPDQNLCFFDSSTHPLGDPELRVTIA